MLRAIALNTRRYCLLACLTLAVTACGGGGGDSSAAPPQNPPPPSPLPTTSLTSDSGRTSLSYMTLNMRVNDLTWDSTNHVLVAATSASSPANPSSIVTIDSTTGLVISARSVASEAKAVAVSSDGRYVYAGFGAGGGVQRFNAPGLTTDLAIPVGTASSSVLQIRVSPVAPRTIAVIADNLAAPAGDGGVEILDDAVARPDIVAGNISQPPLYNPVAVASVSWTPDGSMIYAPIIRSGGILDLAVTRTGVTIAQWRHWPLSSPGRLAGTLLYVDDGRILDLVGPVEQLGRFPEGANSSWIRAELFANGKAFSANDHYGPGPSIDGMSLTAFDTRNFTPIDTITFIGITTVGYGARLFTWGANGIAYADATRLIIASGTFAASGGAAAIAAAPELADAGTVNGSAGALNYKILAFGATDVVADSCGHLYVATSGLSPFRPNSIVAYDVASGTVMGSVYAGSEPFNLAVSDDCGTLYAGLRFSNSVVRINAVSMIVEATLPLGGDLVHQDDFAFARSMSVAPGSPQTLAVSMGTLNLGLCNGVDIRLSIFDDTTQRPVVYGEGSTYSVKSIVWGDTAQTLYGEDWNNTYSFTVDATGIHDPLALYPYRAGTSVYDLGRDLYFDRLTGRIYDSFGYVFDTRTAANLGPVALNPSAAIVNGCGTPSVARTTDSSSGKIFYVSWDGSIHISTYDSASLALSATALIPFNQISVDLELPLRVARSTADGLAFVTASGYLVLAQGPMLQP